MTHAIQQIPLSKLVPSAANVRKANRTEGLKQLSASIKAHGLLQNLTVRRSEGGKSFEVIAGGRRLAALLALAKQKALPKHAPIPCKVIGKDDSATELSLAENSGQAPMHPADQYEAFAKLHDEGMSAEDIAARFGISASVVKQRLKLGAVSPNLIKRYRDGEMNLDQLTAFTITDDHKKQEKVWKELPHHKSRHSILEALSEGQVASDDRRASFIGAKAYQAAGGAIIRDLFDEEGGGFFIDAALLNRLVREKLHAVADPVFMEGWKWVAVDPEFDVEAASKMRRVRPQAVPLSEADQSKLDDLSAKYDALAEEGSEDDAEELDRLNAAIEALTNGEYFPADIMAMAGVFVALGHDGEPRILRGYVRPEDHAAVKENAAESNEASDAVEEAGAKPLAATLVAELTTFRTSVLRNALAENSEVAYLAVLHALAGRVFYPHADEPSCLQIAGHQPYLAQHAPGIGEAKPELAIAERHGAWEKRLPESPEGLWAFVAALDQSERMNLLAHCASLTLNAVHAPKARGPRGGSHAALLAEALGIDMAAHWQPTVENYLGRVSKERIFEAVKEGVTKEAAENLAAMKKGDMAAMAEQRLAGRGWLPDPLRS